MLLMYKEIYFSAAFLPFCTADGKIFLPQIHAGCDSTGVMNP